MAEHEVVNGRDSIIANVLETQVAPQLKRTSVGRQYGTGLEALLPAGEQRGSASPHSRERAQVIELAVTSFLRQLDGILEKHSIADGAAQMEGPKRPVVQPALLLGREYG